MALADWSNGYIPIITHHFFTENTPNTFSTRGFGYKYLWVKNIDRGTHRMFALTRQGQGPL